MKKLTVLIISGAMLLSLCGCSFFGDLTQKVGDAVEVAVNNATKEAVESIVQQLPEGEYGKLVEDFLKNSTDGASQEEVDGLLNGLLEEAMKNMTEEERAEFLEDFMENAMENMPKDELEGLMQDFFAGMAENTQP